MNEGDIAERFIRLAEIYRAIPERVGPQPPRSVALPYLHDWVDKLGWGAKRLEEERTAFWQSLGLMPSSRELSELEILQAWLRALDDPQERRALLAWSRAKAGGMAFKKWCFKVENIHPQTGRRRKDRAIAKIIAELSGKPLLHSETSSEDVLLETAEIAYLPDNIATRRATQGGIQSFADDLAFQPVIVGADHDFSWAEKRNEMRRQRAARQRKTDDQPRKSASGVRL